MSKDGQLLPGVLALIDYIAQHHQFVLETGHVSAEEALMVVHAAHQRGVSHIVVTHAMAGPINMTIPQMQQAAARRRVYRIHLCRDPAAQFPEQYVTQSSNSKNRFVLSENARATVSAIYENLSVDSRASAGVAIAPEPDALRHQPGMMQAM